MGWLPLVVSLFAVWAFACVLVVALCVSAGRGERALRASRPRRIRSARFQRAKHLGAA